MKKLSILSAALFALLSASFGQITRDASDSIVLGRMSKESRPHIVYAKTDTAAIATKAGELLELDYPCWIYYIHYCDQAEDSLAARRYLVVKESSGNVLEVRTKNDVSPDLETWRIVPLCDSMRNTKWKLVYMVDVEADSIKVFEPIENLYPDMYTLTFAIGNTLLGKGVANRLIGGYKIGCKTNNIYVSIQLETFANQLYDEELYIELLNGVSCFSVHENKLLLYYNDKQNYLLFNLLEL